MTFEIVASIVVVVVVVAVLVVVLWRVLRPSKRVVTKMILDFMVKFPGRCMICSYHEYGVREGHIPPSPPDSHDCIEVQPT